MTLIISSVHTANWDVTGRLHDAEYAKCRGTPLSGIPPDLCAYLVSTPGAITYALVRPRPLEEKHHIGTIGHCVLERSVYLCYRIYDIWHTSQSRDGHLDNSRMVAVDGAVAELSNAPGWKGNGWVLVEI